LPLSQSLRKSGRLFPDQNGNPYLQVSGSESQSLRKSGRLFRYLKTNYAREKMMSQSLRKSGRLFLSVGVEMTQLDLNCRNPFVNQVVCFEGAGGSRLLQAPDRSQSLRKSGRLFLKTYIDNKKLTASSVAIPS